MKIDRQIGILTLLLQQDKATAPELAQRFEVSRRTINRDIEDLCLAGIPMVTTQGYGGGISIAEGYTLDKTLLTREDLQAMVAALRGLDSVSAAPHLADIIAKLSGRGTRLTTDDVILIDLGSHYQDSLTQKIDLLKQTIAARHLAAFDYYSREGESRRTVEPYHLVFRWADWYLFGFCRQRDTFRLFKLKRLWNCEDTGKPFQDREIPESAVAFDNFLQEPGLRLKALFAPEQKYRLIEEFGPDCFIETAAGELLFEFGFASYDHMCEWVLSFGARVAVLEPPELKADIKNQAQNILERLDST